MFIKIVKPSNIRVLQELLSDSDLKFFVKNKGPFRIRDLNRQIEFQLWITELFRRITYETFDLQINRSYLVVKIFSKF